MAKLNAECREFIKMELKLGLSNTELAKRFGVTEGTIRYHKKRKANKITDGRKDRYSGVSEFSTPIESWIQYNLKAAKKRNTILSLYRKLVEFHNYNLSYDALRRYIRKQYPEIMKKSYHIRIETPPGKLSQVDWKESVKVQMGKPENWISINFLIVLLCFSRKPAIITRERRDSNSFLSAHDAAVRKHGGATEYYRPDCMSTAVKLWSGRNSEMNKDYSELLEQYDAKPFPARPRTATDKGKVEKKIQDIFRDAEFRRIVFRDMSHLQEYIDELVEQHCMRTICPSTGTTIAEAYEYEKNYLNTDITETVSLPVESIITKVQRDSLIWFKGNYYQIPQGFTGKKVRCINTGTRIDIYHEGALLETYGYEPGIKGMVRMSLKAAETTSRPMSDLVKNWWLEVAERQMDYYQEITGAAK